MNQGPILDSQRLRLTSIDIQADPAVIANSSNYLEIARRLRNQQPLRPLSEYEARKVLEEWLKVPEHSHRAYVFALRPQESERLVGYFHISQIMWVHGAARFDLVIGDLADWSTYAEEALQLGLNYAFDELNMFRVTVQVEEHNELSRSLYSAAQFYLEVRQRQAVFHAGRYWDRLFFGMLRPEWAMYQSQQVGVVA